MPFTVSEWNKLDLDVRNVETYSLFHKNLLEFVRSIENSIYSVYDPVGVKLPHRLRLDSVIYVKISSGIIFQAILMTKLNSINSNFNTLDRDELISDPPFMQIKILITPISRTINFIKQTERFEPALYWANEIRICDLTLWNRSRTSSC